MTSISWTTVSVTFQDFTNGVRPREGKPPIYDLDPSHQRDVVHTDAWQGEIIDSGLRFGMIPTVYFHPRKSKETGKTVKESLDGKQRCMAVVRFLSGDFRIKLPNFGITTLTKFEDLPEDLRFRIEDCTLDLKISSRTLTEPEIKEFFNRAQKTIKTSPGEFLNSCTTSVCRQIYDANEEYLSALCLLISPGTRHDHVSMFCRLWVAYDSMKNPKTSFYAKDTATLERFWTTKTDSDPEDIAVFLESISILRIIHNLGLPRPRGSLPQCTYIPIYRFLLEFYFKKEPASAEQTLTALQGLFSAEPDVFGQVQGSGETEARGRFNLLKIRLGKI